MKWARREASRKVSLPNRASREELVQLRRGRDQQSGWRPSTRGECDRVPRPCPYVSCSYHLYLDVQPNGTLVLNQPDAEVYELEHSCALDVADEGGITLERLGAVLNLTRERVRQLEAIALGRVDQALLSSHVDTAPAVAPAKTCRCGARFAPTTRSQEFCGPDCEARPSNVRRPTDAGKSTRHYGKAVCPCGVEFVRRHHSQRYHSPGCHARKPAPKGGYGVGTCPPPCGASFKRNSGRHTYCRGADCPHEGLRQAAGAERVAMQAVSRALAVLDPEARARVIGWAVRIWAGRSE